MATTFNDSTNIYQTWYRRWNGANWDRIAFKTYATAVTVATDERWAAQGVSGDTDLNALLLSAYSWGSAYSKAMSSNTGTILTTSNLTGGTGEAVSKSTKIYSVGAVDAKFGALEASDIKYGGQGYNDDSVSTVEDVLEAIDDKFARKADMNVTTYSKDESVTTVIGFVKDVNQADGVISVEFNKWAESLDSSYSTPAKNSVVKKYVDDSITALNTDLTNKINGKVDVYVIDTTKSGNERFNIQKSSGVQSLPVAKKNNENASFTTVDNAVIYFKNLKKGDTIFTSTTGVTDWFFGGEDDDGNWVFYRIEADLPDMSLYVRKTTTVNGHALSSDVTVTAGDVGLGNVANTGDSATPTSGGTTKFTTGGAYSMQSSLKTEINKKQNANQTLTDLVSALGNSQTTGTIAKSSYGSLEAEYSGDANSGQGGWVFTIKRHQKVFIQSAEPAASEAAVNDIFIAI